MAKINLLTIHWGNCYGAVFQTYATCKMLEELGHEVTVINLVHNKVRAKFKHLKEYTNLLAHYQFWCFKRRCFPKMTKKMFVLDKQLLPDADYTIIGSDQVWNRNITSYQALNYFGDFADNKLIALSSSFGRKTWTEDSEYTNVVKSLLDRFVAISVREDSAVDILKDQFDLSSIQLLDPTLAYGKFLPLVKQGKRNNKVFCFTYNSTGEVGQIKKEVASALNFKLQPENFFTRRLNASPMDWLNNIYSSEFVITDSFHGVAFCLIYKKNFVVLCANKEKFTRLESLLKKVNLQNRVIQSLEDLHQRKEMLFEKIDYTKVDEILNQEREIYKEFLLKVIK